MYDTRMKLCPHSIIKTIFPKLLLSLNKDIVSSNFSKSKMNSLSALQSSIFWANNSFSLSRICLSRKISCLVTCCAANSAILLSNNCRAWSSSNGPTSLSLLSASSWRRSDFYDVYSGSFSYFNNFFHFQHYYRFPYDSSTYFKSFQKYFSL